MSSIKHNDEEPKIEIIAEPVTKVAKVKEIQEEVLAENSDKADTSSSGSNSSKSEGKVEENAHKKNLIALDKKIVIKEQKEKNKNKTYVSGLSSIDGLDKMKALEQFAKKLKTKFGCGCNITPDEKNAKKFILVLQGNHKESISRYLKELYPKVIIG
jgi:translation initiation factor 1 (eIF-1/SUI1)